jgi:hypothetical protein
MKQQPHQLDSNSTIDDRLRRTHLSCSYCPPNRGENAGRYVKHGEQKPRYKNKRQKTAKSQ